jgi:hypothetical protein
VVAEVLIRKITATENGCSIVGNHNFVVHAMIETGKLS